ncbi:threonine-phosphate decarboxylase [Siphonobacter curvatus]|uniref:Aminotransferase n=1 Tax=Siphonobacter curvatus TaxID=2094562 RepID=A0A2S7IH00_9BACT|nr:threonine-phosphate decarboxylase [Siphonobacter curvatus]PQA54905.1 pyridoxal phosphate-dependent class II aminotransferase [Siphonobacter curvatus]
MLQGHGDDGYQYGKPILADFSTNVWYGGEPAGLKAYLFDRWSSINRYPEVLAESLIERLSVHHQQAPTQFLVNSGTTESIYLVAQAFAGSRTTIVIPAFAEYEDATRMHGHTLTFLPWEQTEALPESDLVFICNPNNPTGAVFQKLDYWLQTYPQTVFVVDEAFIDFTRAIDSCESLIASYGNLIILRSLTKTYAIPGLRLGYVMAQENGIERLKRYKQPWTVNALALAAGHFIFEHFDAIQLPLDQLLIDKEKVVTALRTHSGLRIHNSHTHFFLGETLDNTAAELKRYLLESHGLLIRDASNFRGLSPRHFRIATRTPEENQWLLNALQTWPC